MFTEMRVSQTLLQTWHDHFATIYTSSHSFLQFSGHNLKCSLTVSLYNLTIPSNHSAMNCQQSTPLFTRDTLSTFELPGTHSEYFNSLTSRTAESRLPFPWSPEAPGKGRWGMRARHPTTSDAYDLEPQMACFLHHCSIGAGWSELKHGVDQWEHSGAKHGAAHGDVTLEYGCTYIYVHWIKKTASFFFCFALLQTS
jgi:hypothetical protein